LLDALHLGLEQRDNVSRKSIAHPFDNVEGAIFVDVVKVQLCERDVACAGDEVDDLLLPFSMIL
jgi:hypothetical protein